MSFASGRRMNAEEAELLSRARSGARSGTGGRSGRYVHSKSFAAQPAHSSPAYPPNLSPTTLGLLGQIDALLHAPPQPPRWALMRALSILEEHHAGT
jgi:hypothetical protein